MTSDLDAAFEAAELPTGGRLAAGDYPAATVTSVTYQTASDKIWKPWMTAVLEVQFTTDEGRVTTQWELAPCQKKDGTINNGWMRYLKKNLRNLGYDADKGMKLSGLESAVMSGFFHGTIADISIVDQPQEKINPHTGEPYVDRSVYVNELVEQGLAADAPVAVGAGASDDVPF